MKEFEGYRVLLAEDDEIAREIVANIVEDLVAAVRADPALASNRVYLFTAEVEMKDTYAEKGFEGILLKPANLEALKSLMS